MNNWKLKLHDENLINVGIKKISLISINILFVSKGPLKINSFLGQMMSQDSVEREGYGIGAKESM